MKKIIPFSNGTEAMMWLEDNCDACRTRSGCSAKRNIEQGFITGEITIRAAEFIGYDGYKYETAGIKCKTLSADHE